MNKGNKKTGIPRLNTLLLMIAFALLPLITQAVDPKMEFDGDTSIDGNLNVANFKTLYTSKIMGYAGGTGPTVTVGDEAGDRFMVSAGVIKLNGPTQVNASLTAGSLSTGVINPSGMATIEFGATVEGAIDLTATRFVNVHSPKLCVDQNICLYDDKWIGIGSTAARLIYDTTPSPDEIQIRDAMLDVVVPSASSSAETVAEFGVADAASDYLRIANGTSVDSRFAPALIGYQQNAASASLYLLGQIPASADSGTASVVAIDGRRTGAPLQTRPIFSVRNYGTDVLKVAPGGHTAIAGGLALGTTTLPTQTAFTCTGGAAIGGGLAVGSTAVPEETILRPPQGYGRPYYGGLQHGDIFFDLAGGDYGSGGFYVWDANSAEWALWFSMPSGH